MNDRPLGLSIGGIWFNARPRPAVRGEAEGASLARLLGAKDIAQPRNKALGGNAAVTDPSATGAGRQKDFAHGTGIGCDTRKLARWG